MKLHTRWTGEGIISQADGPIWTPEQVTWSKGRRSRPDFRSYPFFAGTGPEVALVEVP